MVTQLRGVVASALPIPNSQVRYTERKPSEHQSHQSQVSDNSTAPLPEEEATAKLLDGVDVTLALARREREGLQLLKESTAAAALLTGRVRVEVGERIHDQ